ncbi:hypothetical protein P7K49_011846 [Saguinus oedipus]|uniref:Uncharacterized protein n=1 Tax=Saguinus oedipus TaxID=9490 RepID=A0ABQ9VRU8_SAGOE|nr:hypothetical protein P7K49_011846 [Saguinus oedipus]
MAVAEAVYGGGASPWLQEKPLERLLIAGPRAAVAQRSAVGRGGSERRWQGPRAGGREPQGVRDEEGYRPWGRVGDGTSPLSRSSLTEVVGPGTDNGGVCGKLASCPP